MIDASTQKPLVVRHYSKRPDVGPYLMIPDGQLPDLRRLLDEHGVRYEVLSGRVSFDNGPYKARVSFHYKEKPDSLQSLLDSVP